VFLYFDVVVTQCIFFNTGLSTLHSFQLFVSNDFLIFIFFGFWNDCLNPVALFGCYGLELNLLVICV
jgi:hypothetical protein